MNPELLEIHIRELPYYLKVYQKVNKETNTINVEIHSRVHVDKIVEMPHSWSIDFVQDRYKYFLGDVLSFIVKSYGLVRQETKYI